MAKKSAKTASPKLQRKQAKQTRKLVRQEEKQARKDARRQQQSKVAYRSLVHRDQAAELIEEVLAGLRAGKISVEHGEELSFEPPEVVEVRVKARHTWKTEGISIRVRWPRTAAGDSGKIKVATG